MKYKLSLLKSLYTKQAVLYTISLYLEELDYSLEEDEKNYILSFSNIEEDDFKMIQSELTFNTLRFEIADKNKDLRKAIISKALGSINVE